MEMISVTVVGADFTPIFGPEFLPSYHTIQALRKRLLFGDGCEVDSLALLEPYCVLNDNDTMAGLPTEALLLAAKQLPDDGLDERQRSPSPLPLLDWEVRWRECLKVGDLIGEKTGNPYVIEHEIGSGVQAIVFRCRKLSTDELFAVKVFKKRRLQEGDARLQLEREVEALRSLAHECVVSFVDAFEDEIHYFVVTELVQGGDLHGVVQRSGNISEARARRIFIQLLEGIRHIHSKNILHRDLKLENILIDEKSDSVKIADLGWSRTVASEPPVYVSSSLLPPVPHLDRARTVCGTPAYWAPEVFVPSRRDSFGAYGYSVDYWNLGVCLYQMLTGMSPFVSSVDGSSHYDLQERLAIGDFIKNERWEALSAPARHLIAGLLQADTKERFGFHQCRNHRWVSDETGKFLLGPSQGKMVSETDGQRSFIHKRATFHAANTCRSGHLRRVGSCIYPLTTSW